MKGAFGLVGLLMVIGIIVYALGPGGGTNYTGEVLKKGKSATEDVNQLAGSARKGGMTFKESLTVDEQSAGGRTVALLVNTIDPAGPAFTYFGLKRGDLITEIGPLEVKAMDGDAALDYLMDNYQKHGTITVMRDEQKITLPGGAAAPGATAAVQPLQQPAQKPAPPKDDRGSLQRQLDNITEAGGKTGGN